MLFNASNSDIPALLTSAIPGRPAHECLSSKDRLEVIQAAAVVLRTIHTLPIANCPCDNVINADLQRAGEQLDQGLIDAAQFAKAVGQSPEDALDELKAAAPTIPTTHFTHGDYALPNIILNRNESAGVVDWSQAGISNPNRDFMCIEKSIARNADEQHVQLLIDAFYQHYEIETPNADEFQFFWKLDQFSAHAV